MHRIGFIGAGLQAKRRIPVIKSFKNSTITKITSLTLDTAKELGEKYIIEVVPTWQEIVKDEDIDIIVVATYPDTHAEISIEALKHGKHVLCEKPLAKTVKEAKAMVTAADKYQKILKCGFNHRYHPAITTAKQLIEQGEIGNLLFGRGIYGYCGRESFQKEWRVNPTHIAGGILMEQGIHLVDLFSWFFSNTINQVHCFKHTLYFPIRPFEDAAFVTLKTSKNQMISINSTNLQWKNTFDFEVYGTDGYVRISGLGQSYGTEKLIIGKKDYTGPFTEEIREYRGEDISWKKEWTDFLEAIDTSSKPLGDGNDGLHAMEIVEAAYTSSHENGITVSL